MRLVNLLKWVFAGLLGLSGFFIRGWYEEVNAKLNVTSQDHTSLMVLTNEVKNLVDNQTRMLEKMDRMDDKLDQIKDKR